MSSTGKLKALGKSLRRVLTLCDDDNMRGFVEYEDDEKSARNCCIQHPHSPAANRGLD